MSEVWRNLGSDAMRNYSAAPAHPSSEFRPSVKRVEGTQGDSPPEESQPPRVVHTSDGPLPAAVYVIDDDASIRRALGRLLRLTQWQVRTFDSAEAFLAELDGLAPGCLVLDIQLGGMNGLDLLAHMKSAHPTWPIIAMSGSDNDTAETEALRLGARAYLRKPFDSEVLIDTVTQALA